MRSATFERYVAQFLGQSILNQNKDNIKIDPRFAISAVTQSQNNTVTIKFETLTGRKLAILVEGDDLDDARCKILIMLRSMAKLHPVSPEVKHTTGIFMNHMLVKRRKRLGFSNKQ